MLIRFKSKLKNRNGTTLTELLAALLIMLMVTSIVAGGLPAAVRAYRKVVDTANAQILMSTTTNALRNELGLASKVQTNGTTITYTKADGLNYTITLDDTIKVTIQSPFQELSREYTLVSEALSTAQGLSISYGTVEHTGDNIVFNNFVVKKGSMELANLPEYVVVNKEVI